MRVACRSPRRPASSVARVAAGGDAGGARAVANGHDDRRATPRSFRPHSTRAGCRRRSIASGRQGSAPSSGSGFRTTRSAGRRISRASSPPVATGSHRCRLFASPSSRSGRSMLSPCGVGRRLARVDPWSSSGERPRGGSRVEGFARTLPGSSPVGIGSQTTVALRARLASESEASLPFSLVVPPERPTTPFGCGGSIPCR